MFPKCELYGVQLLFDDRVGGIQATTATLVYVSLNP